MKLSTIIGSNIAVMRTEPIVWNALERAGVVMYNEPIVLDAIGRVAW